jgi:hypothetical protein
MMIKNKLTFQETAEGVYHISQLSVSNGKVKISLLQAMEAHRIARGLVSHITSTNGW